MPEHTAGPWKVTSGDMTYGPATVRSASNLPIATVERVAATRDQVEANARLIAAAPDLLAALEEVTRCLENWIEVAGEEDFRQYDVDACTDAYAAMRKARGAS